MLFRSTHIVHQKMPVLTQQAYHRGYELPMKQVLMPAIDESFYISTLKAIITLKSTSQTRPSSCRHRAEAKAQRSYNRRPAQFGRCRSSGFARPSETNRLPLALLGRSSLVGESRDAFCVSGHEILTGPSKTIGRS